MQLSQDSQQFLEMLMARADVTPTDPALQESMLQVLATQLNDHIMYTLINALPPVALQRFTQLNELGASQESIQACLLNALPNLQQLTRKAIKEFETMYIGQQNVQMNLPK